MSVIDKTLEEIEEGAHTFEILGRDVDFVAIDWVRDVIRKRLNDAEYPYITEKDIEAVPPASKEFLDECRSVAKKYGKNDGWIPIEKELPKKGENVLLCSDDGRMMIGVFQNDYYTAFGVAVAENYNQTMHNCVAWQSLPEPYRPERRDNYDGK